MLASPTHVKEAQLLHTFQEASPTMGAGGAGMCSTLATAPVLIAQ